MILKESPYVLNVKTSHESTAPYAKILIEQCDKGKSLSHEAFQKPLEMLWPQGKTNLRADTTGLEIRIASNTKRC